MVDNDADLKEYYRSLQIYIDLGLFLILIFSFVVRIIGIGSESDVDKD